MKKIIVISDSHGNNRAVESLQPLVAENDMLIHLGDGASDLRGQAFDADKVYVCAGNCDFFSPLPDEGVIDVEQVRIFFCHGHNYRVKSSLERLVEEGKKRDANVVLYGHTHVAKIDEIDGITLINPGSLRYGVGNGGTYAYLVVQKNKCTAVLVGDGLH